MSKTYKGYELYKMIAEGKIKEGTKFRDNNKQIWKWNGVDFIYTERDYQDIVFTQMDFELIEDEIDIQNIEKIRYYRTSEDDLYNDNFEDFRGVINELVEAVKQLDRKSK